MKFAPSYQSIVWTGTVSGVFSAIVCVGLVVNFFGSRQAILPLDEPAYLALKQQLEADAANTELQERLRNFDAQLRGRYFHQQTFARRGAYLLAAGVVATLLLAHWSATVRRRLPQPKPVFVSTDAEARHTQLGQWAAGSVTFALVAVVLGSTLASRSVLPRNLAELNASPPSLVRSAENVGQTAVDSPQPDTSFAAPPPTAAQLAANWHRFRGPRGSGVSAFTDVPAAWDAASGEGILWKTSVELPGMSSPVVWEKRIFLTGADVERREVYCFDTESGELRWHKPVAEAAAVKGEFGVDEATGYAAPTPAADGRRVYAMFASGDLAAFDFEGNQMWSQDFGLLDNPYGHASSLAMHQDLLIVQLDQAAAKSGKSKLLALNGASGEMVWQTERAVPASWATPIVVEFEGQPRIITCAEPWVIAYAADDGSEIWRAECLQGDVGPSPVYAEGVVYVANDNAVVAAIRDGGEGDVTESHILWSARFGLPDICSPLVADRYLLLIASYGGLVCYDREQGGNEPLWEEDLGAMLLASPSLVGAQVYLISDEGPGWVLKLGASGAERIAENNLGERCFTSPAFQPSRIYVRGEQHLFCIGERTGERGP